MSPPGSSLGPAEGGGWVCVSMGSIMAPFLGLVVLLRLCSGSLTSSTTTFQGVSRPRVIAQGVTASLIGIELWGEAEGGRIKISLPKWSFVEGVQVLGLFAAFSISCWSRGPQIGTLKIPLDGNALHDSATITHGGLACCGPSHANFFCFSIFEPNIDPNGHMQVVLVCPCSETEIRIL